MIDAIKPAIIPAILKTEYKEGEEIKYKPAKISENASDILEIRVKDRKPEPNPDLRYDFEAECIPRDKYAHKDDIALTFVRGNPFFGEENPFEPTTYEEKLAEQLHVDQAHEYDNNNGCRIVTEVKEDGTEVPIDFRMDPMLCSTLKGENKFLNRYRENS